MMQPPLYVSEQDHAALVSELVECNLRTAARLDAQSRAINLLTLTVSKLEARLANRDYRRVRSSDLPTR